VLRPDISISLRAGLDTCYTGLASGLIDIADLFIPILFQRVSFHAAAAVSPPASPEQLVAGGGHPDGYDLVTSHV
jgi:hypothetical protein